MPIKLAERLGDRVVLSQPVRRIVSENGTVTAVADGYSVTAQRAIVAVPPPLAARIDYSPQLPALRDQLTQRMPMGTVMKVHAVYPEPFWRAAGSPARPWPTRRPAQATFDNTPPVGPARDPHGLRRGARPRAQRLGASRDDLRRDVLKNFSDYFGPQAANPTVLPRLRLAGGDLDARLPGVLHRARRAARLRHGDPRAGRAASTGPAPRPSTFWNGYMDGAVRSGERAAKEVLAAL